MLKRLFIGLIKGLVVGGVVGAAFHFGLGWTVTVGLLGYLIAMGAASTALVLAGKPPWRHAAWIESLLKSLFGLALGALLYWLAVSFAQFKLPFALPGVETGVSWTSLPLLYAPVLGIVLGAIAEIDNDEVPGKARVRRGRVEIPEHEEEVTGLKKKKKRRRA